MSVKLSMFVFFRQKAVVGDVGVYFCVAENKEGSEQCTAVKIMTSKSWIAASTVRFAIAMNAGVSRLVCCSNFNFCCSVRSYRTAR